MTWPVLHVTRSIDAEPAKAISLAGDPAALPLWAAGLAGGIRNDEGRWIAESPMGTVEVTFVGPKEAGVLDHDVALPDGTVVRNPLRVMPNDAGSEVVFTLFQRSGMSSDDFANDVRLIAADLDRLADLVESHRSPSS